MLSEHFIYVYILRMILVYGSVYGIGSSNGNICNCQSTRHVQHMREFYVEGGVRDEPEKRL